MAAVLGGEVPEPVRAGELGGVLSGLLVKEPGERMGAGEVEAVLRAVSGGSAEGGVTEEGVVERGVPESDVPQEPARVVVPEGQSGYDVQAPARRRPFPLSLFFG